METLAPNTADYVIIGMIVFSVLVSTMRGFVREALSLVAWIVSFWVAVTFYHPLADQLKPYISNASIQTGAAFLILLVGTLILGAIVNFVLSQFIEKTGLTGTDRMIGVIFGFARGVLLIAVLLLFGRLTPMPQDTWWQTSVLIPRFTPIEVWLRTLLPDSVNSHFVLPT